ncbi:MAG: RDD family protein [Acidobacteriia bacterium]|nr:RDD family protein [Terriglobia bacterium]
MGGSSGGGARWAGAASDAARRPVAYAGFWLRAVAYLVDSLVLAILLGIFILGPLMQRAGISPDNPWALFTNTSRQVMAMNLLATMASWLYWALLESSAWQATLGKRLLGLRVTDLQGRRISFARASGRHFGKMASALTCGIGFLMAGLTAKKQALHDKLASCLVVKKI